MKIEIDQSIKIEQTHKDTAIGIANGNMVAVIIPRKIKRQLKDEFREADRRQLFAYRVFIAGVVLALEYTELKDLSDVVIDIEYPGQNRRLKSIFLEMWSRRNDTVPDVQFKLIGKQSRAHEICYEVTRGQRKPNKKLSYGDLKRLASPRSFRNK